MGWAVAPHAVREKLVLASEAAILCPSNASQMAISSYLAHHDWLGQIKSFREQYRERRDAIDRRPRGAHALPRRWTVPAGGFYTWVKLPEGLDAKSMLPRAVTALVAYVPGTAFYCDGQGADHMRSRFCYPTPDRIREGVRRLAGVVDAEMELVKIFGNGNPVRRRRDTVSFPSPDLA